MFRQHGFKIEVYYTKLMYQNCQKKLDISQKTIGLSMSEQTFKYHLDVLKAVKVTINMYLICENGTKTQVYIHLQYSSDISKTFILQVCWISIWLSP